MPLTTYGRNLILGCTFLNGTRPTSVYYALTLAIPGSSDDASLLVEPAVAEYARKLYTVSSGFYAITPGEISNTSVITFNTPVTDWGMVRGWAMCTALTGGLVIAGGALKQPRRAVAGSVLRIGIDATRLSVR